MEQTNDSDLMGQFEDWRRGELAEAAGVREEQHEREAILVKRASSAVRVRLVMAVVLIVSAALCMSLSWQQAEFFFASSTPTDLGNLRDRFGEGERELAVPADAYVATEGMVIRSQAQAGDYSYFFCPLYNIIVRTERTLPEPPLRLREVEIDEAWLPIIQEKRAFAWDLLVAFEAKGRMMRLDEAPGSMNPLRAFYATEIADAEGGPVYILFDGISPGTQWWYLVVYGVIVLLAGVSLRSYLRASRAFRELLDELDIPEVV